MTVLTSPYSILLCTTALEAGHLQPALSMVILKCLGPCSKRERRMRDRNSPPLAGHLDTC